MSTENEANDAGTKALKGIYQYDEQNILTNDISGITLSTLPVDKARHRAQA